MNKFQKLISPLAIIVVAVLVIGGIVGYNEWSMQQKKDRIDSAFESVRTPGYLKISSKKYQDISKGQNSTQSVSAWVYRYKVTNPDATEQSANSSLVASLQQAGFTIDKNTPASQQVPDAQILAHKDKVNLQIDISQQINQAGAEVIAYEK